MKKILPFLLAIVFVVAMSVPALAVTFNGVELPAPYGNNTSYFAYISESGPMLLAMDVSRNEYYVRAEYVSTAGNGDNVYNIKIVFPENRNVTYYKSDYQMSSYTYESETLTNGFNAYNIAPAMIGYSTVDVKTVEGHVVFQAPLTLEGAIQKSLTAEATQLSRTMMIIALCGVGCLAFLILLPTLKKIFYHFQIK